MSEPALNVAASAARGFDVLQCDPCAKNIRDALVAAGHRGQLIEIRGAGGQDFMICLSHDGGRATITQNGRHLAIRVGNMVFDNLHPDGMAVDAWLADFDAIGGVQVFRVTEF